jgi:hypothetical protein
MKAKTMSRALFVCVSLTAISTTTVQAAPSLLVEFRHSVAAVEGGSPPATVLFDFTAYDTISGAQFLLWEDDYGPSDVGMTFLAPHDVLQDANLSIVRPNTTFNLTTGPANFSDPLSFTAALCGPSTCLQVFVSDLSRYTVTRVERIVDELRFLARPDGFYGLGATQRIRYWGDRIPEPSSALLALLAFAIEAARRSKSCR